MSTESPAHPELAKSVAAKYNKQPFSMLDFNNTAA
jgi:hypothetical protein